MTAKRGKTDTYGSAEQTLEYLTTELGLGVPSARGAIKLAETSQRVFLGDGQYLRRLVPGLYVVEETA
jgi:hypothetical protein